MGSRFSAALRRLAGVDSAETTSVPKVDSGTSNATPSSVAADSRLPTSLHEPDSCDPVVHASRLLCWLQADDGALGEVFSSEIQKAYVELCAELGWTPLSWLRTGREFGKISGPRRYRYLVESGRECRRLVFYVPRAGETFASEAAKKRHPSAPLPHRLEAIEEAIARLSDSVSALAATAGSATGAGPARAVGADGVVPFDSRRA